MADRRMVVQLTAEELRQLFLNAAAEILGSEPGTEPPAPRLLDRAGLALSLDCSLGHIDKLRKQGLPEFKVGDAPRFDYGEVLDWLRARRSTDV